MAVEDGKKDSEEKGLDTENTEDKGVNSDQQCTLRTSNFQKSEKGQSLVFLYCFCTAVDEIIIKVQKYSYID